MAPWHICRHRAKRLGMVHPAVKDLYSWVQNDRGAVFFAFRKIIDSPEAFLVPTTEFLDV